MHFISKFQTNGDKDKTSKEENSLAVQWLGLWASTAGGLGLIPGQGTKIPQAAWHGQKKGEKKDFQREKSRSFSKEEVAESLPQKY